MAEFITFHFQISYRLSLGWRHLSCTKAEYPHVLLEALSGSGASSIYDAVRHELRMPGRAAAYSADWKRRTLFCLVGVDLSNFQIQDEEPSRLFNVADPNTAVEADELVDLPLAPTL